MPPYRREMPAWSAASWNVRQERVTGRAGTRSGSMLELPAGKVTDAPKFSFPVKSARMVAPAALKELWPETNSGNGGVGKVEGWYGSQLAPSTTTVPAPGPPQHRMS